MVNAIISSHSQNQREEIKMSNMLSIRQKCVAVSLAVFTLGAGIMAQSTPAEARKRHNNGDAALALGLFGVLAAGMLIAGSQRGYAEENYYSSGFEPDNYGTQLVHYPQRRPYGGGYHPHRRSGHGFHRQRCSIETRYVQGRHGQIFTKQFRVCY